MFSDIIEVIVNGLNDFQRLLEPIALTMLRLFLKVLALYELYRFWKFYF